jgi:hypothetical protein
MNGLVIRRALTFVILAALMVIPGTLASAQPPTPISEPTSLIQAALQDLSGRLSRILVRGFNANWEWEYAVFPDTRLDCPLPDQVYAQVITAGFIIRLTVDRVVYDYRATEDGGTLFLCSPRDVPTPTLTPAAPPDATPAPAAPLTPAAPVVYQGALAYVGADGEIYVTDLQSGPGTPITAGANARPVTEFPFRDADQRYSLLRWSPDGTRLAFVDARSGTLYVARSGERPAPLARGLAPLMPPAWSPDGDELAYVVPANIIPVDEGAPQRRVMQVQAIPAEGGAPRYAGEFAFGEGCGDGTSDPAQIAYEAEAGYGGAGLALIWTPEGFVHTLNCTGYGLTLTGFDGDERWTLPDVSRIALAPDGTHVAAITAITGTPFALVGLAIIDLVRGEITALLAGPTAPTLSDQLTWAADGSALILAARERGTSLAADADNTLGAGLFPSWPVEAARFTASVWRIPTAGDPPQRLAVIPDEYGIGVLAAAPDGETLIFSLIGSSAPMIEQLNAGTGLEEALAVLPAARLVSMSLRDGSDSTLWQGGAPAFGGTFTAVPASANAAAFVCEGALEPRMTIGGDGRARVQADVVLRESPDGPRIGTVQAGTRFVVQAGPVCAAGKLWWQIVYRNVTGWVAESLGDTYLIEPR